ncbi:hypothetical protein BGZ65_008550, partial [Modicella reniformis]
RLGVQEDIFIDEALSRQQGTRIFATYQRIGQAPIQMREVVTGMFQVEFISKRDEGIYVKLLIEVFEVFEAEAG